MGILLNKVNNPFNIIPIPCIFVVQDPAVYPLVARMTAKLHHIPIQVTLESKSNLECPFNKIKVKLTIKLFDGTMFMIDEFSSHQS